MQLIKILDKQRLNDFVGSLPMSQFLQSFDWGQFQKKVAGKVWRLGIEEDGRLVAAASLIKKALPMGKSYFYCPRGPVINLRFSISDLRFNSVTKDKKQEEILNFLFEGIKKLADEEKVMFLRFEPQSEIINPSAGEAGLKSKIVKTIDVQPSKTLILDLSKSEEELMKDMHPKTRYNIKLAEKKGVKIIEAGIDRFTELWDLMSQTSERDEFRTHGINYYKEMVKLDNRFIKLFFAKYHDKVISMAIFSFFGDQVSYLHGGSANQDRQVMAPYLIHWHCLKLAKESGFKYYDLNGIDEKKWPGVTRFKKGFDGKEINYPGTFDLIFDQGWYNVYRMVRKVRRTF